MVGKKKKKCIKKWKRTGGKEWEKILERKGEKKKKKNRMKKKIEGNTGNKGRGK